MSDSATARATTTTETAAALIARMNWTSKSMSPAREMATVMAEKTTVRPARSTVSSVASRMCSRLTVRRPASPRIRRSSSRNRLTVSSP